MADNFLKRLDDVGVVFVIAAGNHAEEKDEGLEISRFPQKFAQASTKYRTAALNNMILVGAATKQGYRAKFSQTAGYLTTYAPGDQLGYANTASSLLFDSIGRGTSFGEYGTAPNVASLPNACFCRCEKYRRVLMRRVPGISSRTAGGRIGGVPANPRYEVERPAP